MKKCRKCGNNKPLADFYKTGRINGYSSRCRDCHGVGVRICLVCGTSFVGRRNKKLCSKACRRKNRPATFKICPECKHEFGPVNHLNAKYCSNKCKYKAMATGRNPQRKTTTKARAAQSKIGYQIKVGNIIKPGACEDCGATKRKIEAAHYDYNEPLKIKWLCRSCHVKWDNKEPKGGMI